MISTYPSHLVPCGFFWKDLKSIFVDCNDVAAKLGNISHKKELIGKSDFQIPAFHDGAKRFQEDDQEVIQTGKAKKGIPDRFSFPNNITLNLLAYKYPWYDEKKNILGIKGIVIDSLDNVGHHTLEYFINHNSPVKNGLLLAEQEIRVAKEKIQQIFSQSLTIRELECLNFLRKGLNAKSIAVKLNISHRTVEHHFEHIRNKLGIHNKFQLFELMVNYKIF